ncbi:conjugal transfer protein TrbK [Labrys sp. WJW]|uniref:putative entry exclusion protein TrbK-alt n=1 Tax=Labrys sp. WJW TaxID=1737983 RepID=UPI00082A6E0E|nr:putative entry exclusion protein TrbK-alt [Labrys sp. WJW]OCC05408.1 conjugal transfer protein TrbK [Labrys sp. WJW]
MDGKTFARLGAIVFVAVALTVMAIELIGKQDEPLTSPVRLLPSGGDLLREGQRRCQQLGQKAVEDAECPRVWSQTRDRFLGRTSQPFSSPSSQGR